MDISSAPSRMTEKDLAYIKDRVIIKSLKLTFEDGSSASDVWNFIISKEYGTVTHDHTNIPQGTVWLMRSKSTKVKAYKARLEEMKFGKFPDTKSGRAAAKGSSAIAPTNLTVGTFDYYLSLPSSTRGAQRFGQLMYLLESLSKVNSMTHGEFKHLKAFRLSEFMSRAQLSVALTLPQPVVTEAEHKKRWLNGHFDDFHVRHNNDWMPLVATITGTKTEGADLIYNRSFEL
jgi:hypothetical protein